MYEEDYYNMNGFIESATFTFEEDNVMTWYTNWTIPLENDIDY